MPLKVFWRHDARLKIFSAPVRLSVCLSVRRPSVVNFSHFRLLLWNRWTELNQTWQQARSQRPLPSLCFWADRINKMTALASDWLRYFRLLPQNRWTEFNETWQEARFQRPLPSLCFWADRKNKMAALASDWMRHFRLLLWNCWMEFNENWQQARSQRPLPSLSFLGWSEKQDGRPGLWLSDTFSTSPLKPLNGIQRNLTRSRISTSSTNFVFFLPIGKTRWSPWSLIGWYIFDFSSETAEWMHDMWPFRSLVLKHLATHGVGQHYYILVIKILLSVK